jgi:hypothetical protein
MPKLNNIFDGIVFSALVEQNRIAENPVNGLLCPRCKRPLQRISMGNLHALQGRDVALSCCATPIKTFATEEDRAQWEQRGWEEFSRRIGT